MHPYTAFITLFLLACLNGWVAKRKNRSYTAWFFLGIPLGLMGLMILWMLKPKKVEKPTNLLLRYLGSALQKPSLGSRDERAEISSDNL